MTKISFVYFDVGGVVIRDFSGTDNWVKLKKKLGVTKNRESEFEVFWTKYEAEVNAGRDVETLIPMLEKRFDAHFPKDYSFLIDGFVKHFKVNKAIWPVIAKIHKQCSIGLLTNMYTNMFDAINKRGLMPNVNWDVIIDSSVEGMIKPNKQIYELAERKAGVSGKEILFVDNSKVHIDAASKLGWQTFLYDSTKPKEASSRLSNLF